MNQFCRSEGMWRLLDRLTLVRPGEALTPQVKMLVLSLGQRLPSQDTWCSFYIHVFPFMSWSPCSQLGRYEWALANIQECEQKWHLIHGQSAVHAPLSLLWCPWKCPLVQLRDGRSCIPTFCMVRSKTQDLHCEWEITFLCDEGLRFWVNLLGQLCWHPLRLRVKERNVGAGVVVEGLVQGHVLVIHEASSHVQSDGTVFFWTLGRMVDYKIHEYLSFSPGVPGLTGVRCLKCRVKLSLKQGVGKQDPLVLSQHQPANGSASEFPMQLRIQFENSSVAWKCRGFRFGRSGFDFWLHHLLVVWM